MYDERDYDVSLPETSTEELLACVHILFVMFAGDYAAVDKWLMTSNENLMGAVPIDEIRDGEGIVILEYLRDVSSRRMRMANGGEQ